MTYGGYMGNLLEIDLSSRASKAIPTDERLMKDYVGGRGFVAKLLWDMVPPGTEPFSPENVVVMAPGPLSGVHLPASGKVHICLLYTSATPDGRLAGQPLSEGISPVQGADKYGPTAVIKSCAKMDHVRTGGTLLNQKFTPKLLEGQEGIDNLAHLVRAYFRMGGHHIPVSYTHLSQIGRYTMMIAFGAAFGTTVMARVSLFLSRMQFLLKDWLGIVR